MGERYWKNNNPESLKPYHLSPISWLRLWDKTVAFLISKWRGHSRWRTSSGCPEAQAPLVLDRGETDFPAHQRRLRATCPFPLAWPFQQRRLVPRLGKEPPREPAGSEAGTGQTTAETRRKGHFSVSPASEDSWQLRHVFCLVGGIKKAVPFGDYFLFSLA